MKAINRRQFVGAAIALTAGASSPLFAKSGKIAHRTPSRLAPDKLPASARQTARPALLAEALAALDMHGRRLGSRDKLGLVDFSHPSREERFYLVDVAGGRVEQSWLVAHGKGSDPQNSGFVQRFSNLPGSNASSRGAYLTANRYYGKHGQSQRLIGLDPQNDAALERAIVIHGAHYVDPAWIDARGLIGRSFGCFAVEDSAIATVMDQLGEGTLLYAGKSI